MRLGLSLLFVLLAASSAAAGSYSLSGSAGGGYSRSDEWSSSGPHQAGTAWDWDADLAFAGTPFRPGLLQFLAGAQYRSLRTYYFQSRGRTDGLGFRLQAAALGESPLPISLWAAREWTQFTTDAEVQRTGATQITSVGGSGVLQVRDHPSLRLSLRHSEIENRSFGGNTSVEQNTGLSISAAHATKTQEYSLGYDTGWNSGTFVETNYRAHAVAFTGAVGVTDTLLLRLSDNYYLRLPTQDGPTNPRYDDNAFGLGLQWRPGERLTSSLGYAYRHVLVQATGASSLEEVGHGVTQGTLYRLTPDLSMQATAGVTHTTERLGDASASGSAENVGTSLSWRHVLSPALQLGLGGGGSVGLAEPAGGPLALAYGFNAGGGVGGATENVRGNLAYNLAFQRNVSGLSGWTVNQNLNLTAETVVKAVLLRGLLAASGARRQDPLLGAMESRTATLSTAGYWSRYNVQLSAGVSDGLSQALQDPGFSDGLFLPAAFDTHTRFATLSSSLYLGHLSLTALARALAIQAPRRPQTYEEGLGLNASYTVGQMVFLLDSRLSTGGTGTTSHTGNLVMVRVARTFGMGF